MATTPIGLSMAPQGRNRLYSRQINSAGLKTGAAVVYDTSAISNLVKAPTAAAVQGFAGLIATEYQAGGGSAVGEDVELQRDGIGRGILASGSSVTAGQKLVIAGTDGSLRPFVDDTDVDCDIVGESETTLSTVSVNTPILVNLDKGATVYDG